MKTYSQIDVPWDDILANPMVPYFIELHDPSGFAHTLPQDYKPPTQGNPNAGLPINVWVGCSIRKDAFRHAEKLVNVVARLRWLRLQGDFGRGRALKEVGDMLNSWRCSNCGHRGPRRPYSGRCPHAKVMCGDARLDPQIHWLIPDKPLPLRFVEEQETRGIRVHPEPPDILQFKEFWHKREESAHV